MLDRTKLYGIIGSAVSSLILFLILWFVVMPFPLRPTIEDEGIMVSFGESDNGAGLGVTESAAPVEVKPAAAPQPKTSAQPLLTQEKEPSLVVTQPKKTQKQDNQAQILEQQRLEQQRKAAAAAAAEKQRQQQAIAKANDLMGAFGTGGGSGSGTTSGDTRQGNPAGHGTSGGHGWSLDGRSLIGSLATPSYPSNVEGKVTVNIRVDAAGKVTTATVGSPTTISDAQTRNAAVAAAKNTRFSGGSGVSIGTITYNFKLK